MLYSREYYHIKLLFPFLFLKKIKIPKYLRNKNLKISYFYAIFKNMKFLKKRLSLILKKKWIHPLFRFKKIHFNNLLLKKSNKILKFKPKFLNSTIHSNLGISPEIPRPSAPLNKNISFFEPYPLDSGVTKRGPSPLAIQTNKSHFFSLPKGGGSALGMHPPEPAPLPFLGRGWIAPKRGDPLGFALWIKWHIFIRGWGDSPGRPWRVPFGDSPQENSPKGPKKIIYFDPFRTVIKISHIFNHLTQVAYDGIRMNTSEDIRYISGRDQFDSPISYPRDISSSMADYGVKEKVFAGGEGTLPSAIPLEKYEISFFCRPPLGGEVGTFRYKCISAPECLQSQIPLYKNLYGGNRFRSVLGTGVHKFNTLFPWALEGLSAVGTMNHTLGKVPYTKPRYGVSGKKVTPRELWGHQRSPKAAIYTLKKWKLSPWVLIGPPLASAKNLIYPGDALKNLDCILTLGPGGLWHTEGGAFQGCPGGNIISPQKI